LAAAVVLSGSVDSAAVVEADVAALRVRRLPAAERRAHLAHRPRPLVVLQVAVVLAQVPPQPLLLPLLPLLLPRVVVESEGTLHLRGRPSFSAAMAKRSPPTVPSTYERAPSTRSRPNVRTSLSACLKWMPVRG
jgi:hypothetical protein